MTGFLWNALNDAEQHRANAVQARNRGRGGSTVTVYASSRTLDAARGEDADGSGFAVFDLRQAWKLARDDAHEDYLRAAFPERYEGFDEI